MIRDLQRRSRSSLDDVPRQGWGERREEERSTKRENDDNQKQSGGRGVCVGGGGVQERLDVRRRRKKKTYPLPACSNLGKCKKKGRGGTGIVMGGGMRLLAFYGLISS